MTIVDNPVTLKEMELVLKGFVKGKIPSPDGGMVEFFITFFYLVGKDLLAALEQSRTEGYISKAMNATFIALIPKFEKPDSFSDF